MAPETVPRSFEPLRPLRLGGSTPKEGRNRDKATVGRIPKVRRHARSTLRSRRSSVLLPVPRKPERSCTVGAGFTSAAKRSSSTGSSFASFGCFVERDVARVVWLQGVERQFSEEDLAKRRLLLGSHGLTATTAPSPLATKPSHRSIRRPTPHNHGPRTVRDPVGTRCQSTGSPHMRVVRKHTVFVGHRDEGSSGLHATGWQRS